MRTDNKKRKRSNGGAKAQEIEQLNLQMPEWLKEGYVLFTDGSCFKNGQPGGGQSGSACVLANDESRALSFSFGEVKATNQIAELHAISLAFDLLVAIDIEADAAERKDNDTQPKRRARICTDSAYVIGCLGGGWTIKANVERIAALCERKRQLEASGWDIELVKVPAHCGVRWNEMADELARKAAGIVRKAAKKRANYTNHELFVQEDCVRGYFCGAPIISGGVAPNSRGFRVQRAHDRWIKIYQGRNHSSITLAGATGAQLLKNGNPDFVVRVDPQKHEIHVRPPPPPAPFELRDVRSINMPQFYFYL